MSTSEHGTTRLSRQVPLEQLTMPDTDVREMRPEQGVRGLAESMGDPSVGQLQPILVTPAEDPQTGDEWDREALSGYVGDGRDLQIIDGVTRYMAADFLEWETIWAWVVSDPPEDTVIAQLDANTERVEMTQYETVKALADHKEATGASVKELAGKVGYSPSYMSQVLNTLSGPEWLVEAWRNPDHPLETSHAIAVYYMMSEKHVEMYAQAGDLDEDEARARAVEDAQLMVDVQQRHDLQVGDFRQRCQRCRKESLDQLKDKRSLAEKQADGQTQSADRQHTTHQDPQIPDCTCCGSERNVERRYAVHVCPECYGMLSDVEANEETLMTTEKVPMSGPVDGKEADVSPERAAEIVCEATGLDDVQPQALLEELARSGQQAPQEATND